MKTIRELFEICENGGVALLQDVVGVASLGVMLVVVLHLPSLT